MNEYQAMLAAQRKGGKTQQYIEDLFSAYQYIGTGANQAIANGIDLAGKGGLVWLKGREGWDHWMADTSRPGQVISSNRSAAQIGDAGTILNAFGANGFTVGTNGAVNTSSQKFMSWSFRKAAKFMDIVTYTGDSNSARVIPHGLGVTPGMILIKCTSAQSDWCVWHRGMTDPNNMWMRLNTNEGEMAGTLVYGVDATGFKTQDQSGGATTGNPSINFSGKTYVAYVFAHDPSADGMIQCGSYTVDSGGNATVELGWEPQFVLDKFTNTVSGWQLLDTSRGWTADAGYQTLTAETANAEQGLSGYRRVTATGFKAAGFTPGSRIMYVAIRRGPMRKPTSGTQVYNGVLRNGTSTPAAVNVGFPPDFIITRGRPGSPRFFTAVDRLRGKGLHFLMPATSYEFSSTDEFPGFDVQNGFNVGTGSYVNPNGVSMIDWCFRRYPGVFDVVCYAGNGTATQRYPHNLGVRPELMIIKGRTANSEWQVTVRSPVGTWRVGNSINGFKLNSSLTDVVQKSYDNVNDAAQFAPYTINDGWEDFWTVGKTFVVYLFASLAGVSKVGEYTGNGTSLTVNCGFSNGARFLLIRRVDAPSNWTVWDSARGIVAGADPVLFLDSTGGENTTLDTIDPTGVGFIVNQETLNMNVSGATYIFLAIA